MLVRLTQNLDCYVMGWLRILEVAPGSVAGTVIEINPKVMKKPIRVDRPEGGWNERRRSVVQFRLASGSEKLFALVSDIQGNYKKVRPPKK